MSQTGPTSLLEGVGQLAASLLGISNLKHKGVLNSLPSFDGPALVGAMMGRLLDNYRCGGASENRNRSKQNWRWQSLQPQISPQNRSPEVVLERAIASACARLASTDWSNQIPVASGLIDGAGDGRRAIDLVERKGNSHFELIELKIASDTPLYAAIEILVYGLLWLIARKNPPLGASALLSADELDLRVLAPPSFYGTLPLSSLETGLDSGISALGWSYGVAMSFRFDVLPDDLSGVGFPAGDEELLGRVDEFRRVSFWGFLRGICCDS